MYSRPAPNGPAKCLEYRIAIGYQFVERVQNCIVLQVKLLGYSCILIEFRGSVSTMDKEFNTYILYSNRTFM